MFGDRTHRFNHWHEEGSARPGSLWESRGQHGGCRDSPVCLVDLVCFVYPVQPNKRDKPNKPS